MARFGRSEPFKPLLRRFRISVSADVTVALTGIAATCAVGAVTAALSVGFLAGGGVSATGAVGTVVATRTVGLLPGPSATGAVGTLGVSASGSAALTGVAATGAVGSLSASSSGAATLSGVGASGSVGTLGVSASGSAALTGVGATGGVGTLAASSTGGAALTKVSATGSVGTLGVAKSGSAALTGLEATGQVGSLSASVAGGATLSGVGATGDVGTLEALAAGSGAASGVGALGATGLVGPGLEGGLTGESASGAVGDLVPGLGFDQEAALTGVEATGAVGTVEASIVIPPIPAVAARLAVPRVLAAVRALLLADPTLVSQIGTAPAANGGGPAIYSEGAIPEAARPPYLTIGPFSERSDGTMGAGPKWGSELAMPVKLVTMNQDVGVNLMTVDRIVALLHGVWLTVEDYSHGSCVLEVIVDCYTEKLAGRVILHYPTVWTVRVGQAGRAWT